MRNRVLLVFALMVLVGCSTELTNDVVEVRPISDVFTATIENPDTKVFVDEALKTHWNEGDEISIFTTTYNQHFKFDGQTGDDEGTFTELSNQFFTGGEIPTVYAVYPYNENTSVTSEGVLTLTLPDVQNYAENSFGLGANTMVAVTENKSSRALKFKSVCGYVVVRLYGDAIIKSVTLIGNNSEKISGQATVAPVYGKAPAVGMSESAGTNIILDCGEGVELGKTIEEATAFWFAVPPVTFTQGFTIRVTNTDGYSMEKSTHAERTVVRNIKNPLSALEVSGFPIVPEGIIVFEDANFKAYCVENFDEDGDGEISFDEALKIASIDVNTDNITSVKGIEYFKNLTDLKCRGSSEWDSQQGIYVSKGQLFSLDVSHNTELKYLYCSCNQLTSLDLSSNMALTLLGCSCNQLTSLDISYNLALTGLDCNSNKLTILEVSNNTNLGSIVCFNNQLTNLDVSNNLALTTLWCSCNQLTSLDISNNTALTQLYCDGNQLTSLDISQNSELKYLWCYSNLLTILDVSNNSSLIELYVDVNPYLTEIWLNKGQTITRFAYDVDVATIKYRGVDDIIEFEDVNFKAYCVHNFDKDGDHEISFDEALAVKRIVVYTDNISSMKGVEYFKNLTYLNCDGSRSVWYPEEGMTDSSGLLTSLDVSNNTALISLSCANNQLTSLDVSNNTALTGLNCGSNQLSSLDVSHNTALTALWFQFNQLTSLDISNNTALTQLYCNGNKLTSLDISHQTALVELWCESNQLASLDVSNNNALSKLWCRDNPYLTVIWLKKWQTISTLMYDWQIATINYLYYADDFEWMEPWTSAAGSGDDVGTNMSSTGSLSNVFTSVELTSFWEEFIKRGYGYIWGWEGQDWCDSTPESGNGRTLYLKRNYLKFGKTDYNSGIILPALSSIDVISDVTLLFNWCWGMSATGKPDLTSLTVTVSGGGVVESTGTNISNEIISNQPTENEQTELIWQTAQVRILGATASTRITIRPTYNNPMVLNPDRKQQRWYLDNIKVYSSK